MTNIMHLFTIRLLPTFFTCFEQLSSVSGIYLRRFRLRDSALEVFFRKGKHRNFFVDFGHTKDNARQRNDFARALMRYTNVGVYIIFCEWRIGVAHV